MTVAGHRVRWIICAVFAPAYGAIAACSTSNQGPSSSADGGALTDGTSGARDSDGLTAGGDGSTSNDSGVVARDAPGAVDHGGTGGDGASLGDGGSAPSDDGAASGDASAVGDQGGTDGDAAIFDGTVQMDGPVQGDAASDSGPTRKGMVELNQAVNGGSYSVIASADFIRGWAFPAYCTTMQVTPACTTASCPYNVDAGTPAPPNAGRITISGGELDAGLVLIPLSDGTYFQAGQSTQAFAPGDTLSVQAPGNAIPAFSASDVAPSDVTFTTATLSKTFPPPGPVIPIDRTKDWGVAWTGGGAGQVEIQLSTAVQGSHDTTVNCYFDAATGSAVVPAAVLGTLDSSARGTLFVMPLNTKHVTAGDFDVSFIVDGTGLTGQMSTN
jgi:hypothetical protein